MDLMQLHEIGNCRDQNNNFDLCNELSSPYYLQNKKEYAL